MLIDDPAVSAPRRRRDGQLFAIGAAGAVTVAMIVLQVVASRSGFVGPLHSLAADFVGTPKSMSVPWAGLALALVGLSARQRVVAVVAAAGIDGIVLAGRVFAGAGVAAGTGPTWVLAAVALTAVAGRAGWRRDEVLRGAGFGALLIAATKVGDAWLHLTVLTRPVVLDRYLELADRALGSPSWMMGRAVDALGPVAGAVLHWVYIELPVAAIVVALYQLHRRWPAHHLIRTFLAIGLIGPLFYVVFPVVGPDFAFGTAGAGAQVGNYWPVLVPTVTDPAPFVFDAPAPRNCMPSLHTAWALAIFVHTRRAPRWLRWGGAVWLGCTLAATLGFGYHYGVDLVAGVVLCLTVESALRDPERGWDRPRVRLVAGGVAAYALLLVGFRYLAAGIAAAPLVSAPLILGVLGAVVLAFHATHFAAPDTTLGMWGRGLDRRPQPAPCGP